MADINELQALTDDMETQTFLRFLITDRYANRIVATCSLRARSVVLLKLISEIDASTPIVFCHAQALFPESLKYREELVGRLGLTNIREPGDDEGEPLPGDAHHSEGLWAENPVDHTRAYTTVDLNRSLATYDCWISGVYHGPYPEAQEPRVTAHGRLIQVNPLAGWSQDQVRQFMTDNGLKYHPRSALRPADAAGDTPRGVPTYHF